MSNAEAITRNPVILAKLGLARVIWNYDAYYDSYSRHSAYARHIFNTRNTLNIWHTLTEAALDCLLKYSSSYHGDPNCLLGYFGLLS